jgi:cobalt-zinc-cadmium efflux system outer membrane protein
VAAAQLEAAIFEVSEEILNTVAEVKSARNEYIALFRLRQETEEMKWQMEELKNHLTYLQKFGLTKDIDIYMADAEAIELEEELSGVEKDLHISRIHLNRLLGLSTEQSDYEIIGELPEEFKPVPDLETMMAHAFSSRPDIQILKVNIEGAKRVLALEHKRVFNNVEAGIAYEKDPDGTDFMGPDIEIQLPLFDQNQAQIAKAEYRLRQKEKELQARMGLVRAEVTSALGRVSFARSRASLIRNKLVTIRKDAVEYAEKYFDAMQVNMLYLLEARRKFLDAERRLIESLRECRNAEIELEKASGGIMPVQDTGG